MTQFPSALFSKQSAAESDTLDVFGHTQNHNDIQDELAAIEAKVGVDSSTVANAIDWILNQGYRRETGTVAYASTTTFTIAGVDRTAIYKIGTRLRINAAGTPVYVTVVSSVFSTNTTVTVLESSVPNPTTTVDYEINPRGFETIPLNKIQKSPFTSWTPTLANVTLGSGSNVTAKYFQLGIRVSFNIAVTLGTGGSYSGQPTFTLPLTAVNYTSFSQNPSIGRGSLWDAGTADYPAACWFVNTTTAQPVVINTASTYAVFANVSATVPFTSGVGDGFYLQGSYEAAA